MTDTEKVVSERAGAAAEDGAEGATEDTVPAPRAPWWHWRRLTRGRLRPALAAAVAGALLGGAGVAWRTETGPFTADDRACWGALGQDDVAALFGGKRDIETSDVPVVGHTGAEGLSGGLCVLKSPRGRSITVRIHQLDTRFGGAADQWADEFLSARLSPLSGGLLGMASDTRAWLAVPDSCLGRPSEDDGPVVIDVETGWTVYRDEVKVEERDRLARTVVKLVNDFMADEGCDGTIADPVGRMPIPARFQAEQPDAVCGIKGLRLPGRRKDHVRYLPVVTNGAGPVRTCDRDVLFDHPGLRLMTVEDPRLAALYGNLAFDGGTPIEAGEDSDGHGVIRDDLGLFQAACPTGPVTFLVRARDGRRPGDIRALLPRYVAAEADRVGCGPLRIQLPD
ncbi:hypothetical protein [Streptomyces sp. XD-27]|uniref:hypothetical protein n=1 Tax=Streptomyces sp. XD-27 TaxID=3062779 RepID=UPI0026F47847|nr:hypothetical protein [Streptomyces sp. XD-27]WKX73953.1 hypothetical protein Q3Y56_32430 [Streptomyces sp. XD-27]